MTGSVASIIVNLFFLSISKYEFLNGLSLLRYTTKILFASLNFRMLNVSFVSHVLDFVIVIIFGAGYKFLKLFFIYFKLTSLCQ